MKLIYIAGGCFWGTQAFFKKIRGVAKTTVGYANSIVADPTYKQVCSGITKATETVEIKYDKTKVSLVELLEKIMAVIDPAAYNHQGEDYGSQYRSGVYYVDEADKEIIEQYLKSIASNYSKPILTEVLRLKNFYHAEEYHQDYLDKNPNGYCHIKM